MRRPRQPTWRFRFPKEDLLRAFRDGLAHAEAARRLGTSKSSVTQAVKRLDPEAYVRARLAGHQAKQDRLAGGQVARPTVGTAPDPVDVQAELDQDLAVVRPLREELRKWIEEHRETKAGVLTGKGLYAAKVLVDASTKLLNTVLKYQDRLDRWQVHRLFREAVLEMLEEVDPALRAKVEERFHRKFGELRAPLVLQAAAEGDEGAEGQAGA